jgi:hypothetical protein
VGRLLFRDGRVFVLDEGHDRLMTFSPDFAHQETVALVRRAETGSDLIVSGDVIVYSSPGAGPDRGTVVVNRGQSLVSDQLSPTEVAYAGTAQMYIDSHRRLADAGASRFWVSRINKYVLELWDTSGRLSQVITRTAAWFEPWATISGPPWVVRPAPMISTIWYSPDSLIWVALTVARENWKAAPEPRRVSASDESDYVDTLVEVIDPVNGSLVFSRRFPGSRRFVGDRGHLASFTKDADGVIAWTLAQLSLVRP